MGTRFYLAAASMLLTTIAFAGHAVPLDTEAVTAPRPAAPETKTAEPAALPATAATTTGPLQIRAENPALRGICITRYGNRTCY